VNSTTTNERAQASRCAEPRLQTGMTDLTSESLWALVLAGGDGTRLQSLTYLIAGAPIPKQYCRILGPRSPLEATLWRIAPLVAPERTLAIINRDCLAIARPQLTSAPRRASCDAVLGVVISADMSTAVVSAGGC
jgi:mannose-1-phosphate guanylyltransferase